MQTLTSYFYFSRERQPAVEQLDRSLDCPKELVLAMETEPAPKNGISVGEATPEKTKVWLLA